MIDEKRIIIIPDFLIFLKEVHTLDKPSLMDIQTKTQITYSHLHIIMNLLKNKGWITITKEGVKNSIFLTEKGKQIVLAGQDFLNKIEINDEALLKHRRRGRNKKEKKEEKESWLKESDEDTPVKIED